MTNVTAISSLDGSQSALYEVSPRIATQSKRIILVGDSIKLGYAPYVIPLLVGHEVFSHPVNSHSTTEILANFDDWIVKYKPNIVHINAGIHDVKRIPKITSDHVNSPEDYANNVKTILSRIRNETGAAIIWATSTPVRNPEFNDSPKATERGSYIFNQELVEYNKIALDVVNQMGRITVNDLYSQVVSENTVSIYDDTYIHYVPEFQKKQAIQVAKAIRTVLNQSN